MVDKPKILYILFEGLPPTVIDSQVLLHIRHMQENSDYQFEVWSFAPNKPLYEYSLTKKSHAEKLSGAPVHIFPAKRPALPGSTYINGYKIKRLLKKRANEFSFIHARSDYSAACCSGLSKKLKIPVIWDCRGDALAEFVDHFCIKNLYDKLFSFLKIRAVKRNINLAAAGAAGVIFVSNPLEALYHDLTPSIPKEIIPCVAAERLFFPDEHLRVKCRHDLKIPEDETLFIYSGSLAPYQCFEETVTLFSQINKKNPKTHLLILTPDQEKARKFLKKTLDNNNWQVESANVNAVNSYLNAADAGIMLRKPVQTNLVASPTKFAEYVLTGLRVIMNDNVADSSKIAHEIGAYLSFEEACKLRPQPTTSRVSIYKAALPKVTRSGVRHKYVNIYNAMRNLRK
ncbi:hypothetical protein [Kiloniella majae]|uniref:hypothetical protein n=1 Tax=Kiloniella majae TaxID=1938558 RepID=UPI000A277B7E|nr:hypothetical protein [Kiloniella majae]